MTARPRVPDHDAPSRNAGTRRAEPPAAADVVVLEAVGAQLDPPLGQVLRPFDRMRRRRNDAEYPKQDGQTFEPDDARRDQAKAAAIVELAERVLDEMSPF
jgi:hypothetical protein